MEVYTFFLYYTNFIDAARPNPLQVTSAAPFLNRPPRRPFRSPWRGDHHHRLAKINEACNNGKKRERQFNDAVCREQRIDDLVCQRRRAGGERPCVLGGERQFNDAVCREERINDLVRQRRRAGDERPSGGGRTARSSASASPPAGRATWRTC